MLNFKLIIKNLHWSFYKALLACKWDLDGTIISFKLHLDLLDKITSGRITVLMGRDVLRI